MTSTLWSPMICPSQVCKACRSSRLSSPRCRCNSRPGFSTGPCRTPLMRRGSAVCSSTRGATMRGAAPSTAQGRATRETCYRASTGGNKQRASCTGDYRSRGTAQPVQQTLMYVPTFERHYKTLQGSIEAEARLALILGKDLTGIVMSFLRPEPVPWIWQPLPEPEPSPWDPLVEVPTDQGVELPMW